MILNVRVDHRLLHGQVAFTWTTALGSDCILIANDSVVDDQIRKTTMKLAKPAGVKLVIKNVEDSIAAINAGKTDKYKLFIEIGKQYSSSHKDLIDTLVHEELEARIIRNRHHRELYCKFVEANDDDIIHTYIQRLVDRFLLIKGVR